MDSVSAASDLAAPCGAWVAQNVVFSNDFIDLELIVTSSGAPLGAPSQELHEFPMIL